MGKLPQDEKEAARLVFRNTTILKNAASVIILTRYKTVGRYHLYMAWGDWNSFLDKDIDGLQIKGHESNLDVLSPETHALWNAERVVETRLSRGYKFIESMSSWPITCHALGFGPTLAISLSTTATSNSNAAQNGITKAAKATATQLSQFEQSIQQTRQQTATITRSIGLAAHWEEAVMGLVEEHYAEELRKNMDQDTIAGYLEL